MSRHAFASRFVIPPLMLVAGSAMLGCEERAPHLGLPHDDKVVAKVNGSAVTRYEVEHLGARGLGELTAAVSSESYPRIREAAIKSRAIALAAEAELSSVEKLALAKEVAAYREQLLVRRYLNKHAPPPPVTAAMARDYYEQHPERFGGKKELSYELLSATRSLAPSEREKLLNALKDATDGSDWAALADKLSRAGLPVALTVASPSDRVLHEQLRELLNQLQPGKASAPTFIQGRLYVARVKGETTRAPRPFEEVRPDIERLLQPSQLSSSIERVSKDVMAQAHVEILESDTAPTRSEAKP